MADTTDLKSVAGNSVWVRVPPSLPPMTIKRNHWQNEEVIQILKHLRLDPTYEHYNYALDQVNSIFARFEQHYTEPAALAYLTDQDTIIGVGPKKYEHQS